MGQCSLPEKVPIEVMAALALGTVQFGLHYGVANQSGRVTQSEVEAILIRAAAAGVDTLDTAIAYGDSEACLGNAGVSSWRIVTKLPPLPEHVHDVSKWAQTQIEGSLRRLRVTRLDALLLHRSSDVLGTQGEAYRRVLGEFKKAGLARSIGASIYDPVELDALWNVWRPELIQAPFNVLDRRLAQSGWLDRLARYGVRVHTRSAFLQGLLLMPAERRPAWFAPWRELLDGWLEWCHQHRLSPLQGALAFTRTQPGIEHVVVGVDSVAHLEDILGGTVDAVPVPPANLFSQDRDLIEPSRWRVS